MVEIPTPKQTRFDALSAVKGKGFKGVRHSIDGLQKSITLEPSQKETIAAGFISFVKYGYPGKDFVAHLEEQFLDIIFADRHEHFLPVFEDQYISSGGQLYEILTGKDRFTADIRPALFNAYPDLRKGHVCHPYDMAALLIAQETGIIMTNISGADLDAPMNTTDPVNWVAYCNPTLHEIISPIFLDILKKKNFY